MTKKNKLVLIEPEMTEPKGHFLNNLIDISKFFENKLKIHWILNKRFQNKGTYIPKKITKIYGISSNKYKRKANKFLYFLEEVYTFFVNFFYTIFFLLYFIKEKKTFLYISAIRSNYYIIPKYFKSFYFNYKSLNLSQKDHIFFPSARRKDIALINFLSKIDINHPNFHLRLSLQQKIKFKGFFYYLKEVDNKLINKRVSIYVWKNDFKTFLKKSLSKKGIYETNLMFAVHPNFKFNRKLKRKNLVIGYLGNARRSKGFHLLPHIIELLEAKKCYFNYFIHFSNISNDLIQVKKKLYQLAKTNNRLKIIEKYSSHKEFIEHLKKIDIMPILHKANEINSVTSGTLYSCTPYQIPFVVPKGVNFLKNINKYRSFETAKNINEFVEKIILISKNYNFYLKNIKMNSQSLKKLLNNDPIIKNLD